MEDAIGPRAARTWAAHSLSHHSLKETLWTNGRGESPSSIDQVAVAITTPVMNAKQENTRRSFNTSTGRSPSGSRTAR